MALADQISSLVTWYYGIPLFLFVVFHNRKCFFLVTLLTVTSLIAESIKFSTRNVGWQWLKRPKGAKDCNVANCGGSCEGKPGFPSGHCATNAVFWGTLWVLFPEYRSILVWIGGATQVTMMWARTHKKCHTWIQVLGGTLFGGFLSALVFFLRPWIPV
jgi:membrane-associated phospholipid phosphatase